jgi:glycosyltransferase involved in cell wall biosynthesis
VVLRDRPRSRWGGDLRRHYLFSALVRESGNYIVEDWNDRTLRLSVPKWRRRRWQVWRRPPVVVSSELLRPQLIVIAATKGVLGAVDIHDDSVLQAEALGVDIDEPTTTAVRARLVQNLEAFRWHIAPSRAFADLVGLEPSRVIVASNGSDTRLIHPEPWPELPAVGFISGAAPARGIEELIAAVRMVRAEVAGVRLLLWLAETGPASSAYLGALRESVARESWIEIDAVPYDRLSPQLGRATILCIPTPFHRYWESVAPIKLFDCMAAGRPIVSTPRKASVELVDRAEGGAIASGDDASALAAALLPLIADPARARRLGSNARALVEREYDWHIVSARLARALGQKFRW